MASRDKIGNAVLDRDDELAALYAKNATQAEVLAAGELARRARRGGARAGGGAGGDARHEIAASAAAFAPALDEQIVALRAQLLRERREAERLGAEAEDPSNERRRRDLAGDAPDRDALRAKLRGLEKRELERDVALRKKDAELEELTRVSDRLRAAAAAGRAETLELARAVRRAGQSFSRRRETEALAAELAMYRASALSFEETLGAVRDALARAERNIAAGAPPDEDAAREWSRATRSRPPPRARRRDGKKNTRLRARTAAGTPRLTRAEGRRRRRKRTPRLVRTRTSPRTPRPRVSLSRTARTRRSSPRRRRRI